MNTDLILVGGGLANCMIALSVIARRPDTNIILLERNAAVGGNHTWCFHSSDITADQLADLQPLVHQSWDGYDIRFPNRRRTLPGGYHAIISDTLHSHVTRRLGSQIICNADVETVSPESVTLTDGRQFHAPAVIDGRGDDGNPALWVGFQKFVGQVVNLSEPHGLTAPILMDATVPQLDGFRFFYVLPFTPTCLLVEDTRYSDSPTLDVDTMRQEIAEYIRTAGWTLQNIEREEDGALPVVLDGDIEKFWQQAPGVPRSGLRAGLFNYITGYSIPEAVRSAEAVATVDELRSPELYALLRGRSENLWRRGRFLRMLNRMLFLAADPAERYRVLQHFYRLPTVTVNRFYAGRPNAGDKMRILSGRPPVPVGSALKAILSGGRSSQNSLRSR
jgi:lycopene beta-cyclase